MQVQMYLKKPLEAPLLNSLRGQDIRQFSVGV